MLAATFAFGDARAQDPAGGIDPNAPVLRFHIAAPFQGLPELFAGMGLFADPAALTESLAGAAARMLGGEPGSPDGAARRLPLAASISALAGAHYGIDSGGSPEFALFIGSPAPGDLADMLAGLDLRRVRPAAEASDSGKKNATDHAWYVAATDHGALLARPAGRAPNPGAARTDDSAAFPGGTPPGFRVSADVDPLLRLVRSAFPFGPDRQGIETFVSALRLDAFGRLAGWDAEEGFRLRFVPRRESRILDTLLSASDRSWITPALPATCTFALEIHADLREALPAVISEATSTGRPPAADILDSIETTRLRTGLTPGHIAPHLGSGAAVARMPDPDAPAGDSIWVFVAACTRTEALETIAIDLVRRWHVPPGESRPATETTAAAAGPVVTTGIGRGTLIEDRSGRVDFSVGLMADRLFLGPPPAVRLCLRAAAGEIPSLGPIVRDSETWAPALAHVVVDPRALLEDDTTLAALLPYLAPATRVAARLSATPEGLLLSSRLTGRAIVALLIAGLLLHEDAAGDRLSCRDALESYWDRVLRHGNRDAVESAPLDRPETSGGESQDRLCPAGRGGGCAYVRIGNDGREPRLSGIAAFCPNPFHGRIVVLTTGFAVEIPEEIWRRSGLPGSR